MSARTRVGRYEIVGELARTALGTINLARVAAGDDLGRIALMRRIELHPPVDESVLDELRASALVALRIHHPSVLALLELVPDGEGLALANEYVEGVFLRALLATMRERKQRLPGGVALRLGLELSQAVAEAKRVLAESGSSPLLPGLTPDSVLIGSSGDTLIASLGLALLRQPLAAPELLIYRAPEQLAGGEPDERSEVYSVGVLIWELVAGRDPFSSTSDAGGSSRRLGQRSFEKVVPRLDEAAPGFVQPAVVEIIMQAVAQDPAARLPSVSVLAETLATLGKASIARPEQFRAQLLPFLGPLLDEQRRILEAATSPDDGVGPASWRPTFRPERPASRAIGLAAFPRDPSLPRDAAVPSLSVESARGIDELLQSRPSAAGAADQPIRVEASVSAAPLVIEVEPAAVAPPITGLTIAGVGDEARVEREQARAAVAQLPPAWQRAERISSIAPAPRGSRRALAMVLFLLIMGGAVAIAVIALQSGAAGEASSEPLSPALPGVEPGSPSAESLAGGGDPAPGSSAQRGSASTKRRRGTRPLALPVAPLESATPSVSASPSAAAPPKPPEPASDNPY